MEANKSKFWRLVPFILIVITAAYNLYLMMKADVPLFDKFKIGAISIIINLLIYFFRFKIGVIVTGVILPVALFNLSSFVMSIDTYYFGVGNFRIPDIQLQALILLVIYLCFNWTFLRNAFRRLPGN